MVNLEKWRELYEEFTAKGVTLIAVSKIKPASDIQEMYDAGQRHFGENYVQELTEKQKELPQDIRWHFIGHLQSNKVKYIAPFIHLIQGVDNTRLLTEINKQAQKNNRIIDVLLQVYIAAEETKFGMDEAEISEALQIKDTLPNVRICGLMGMATNTDDAAQVRSEFARLNNLFQQVKTTVMKDKTYFNTLSMGMSGDYADAIAAGSNMVRIGSLLFGKRQYNN